MTKMTRIALASYWGLLMLLSIVRSTLIFITGRIIPFTDYALAIIWIITFLAILSLTSVTMVIYYTLDVGLETTRTNENTKEETNDKDEGASEVIDSQKQNPRVTLSSSFKMEAWTSTIII